MFKQNPQKWFDKTYFKDKEENIDIKKGDIRNILGRKSNLHGSLKIEDFTKLKSINLKKLKLTSLEIINCSQLTRVNLSEHIKLENLFISKCPRLTKLDCSHSQLNELTNLDVSNLIELDCSNTLIKKLSLNLCPDIIRLNCSNNNKLVNLDVSNCFKLKFLDCSQSKLTKLDLRNCPESIEVIKPPGCVITRKKEKIKNILIIGCTGSGKSTLANVLTGTEDFKESEYGVSKTKSFQKGDFEWEGTKYCAIDTIGIGNTKLSIKLVSNRIAEGVLSIPEGISQVLLVVGKNFTDEINTLGLFGSDIFGYTTIVRTKFSNFKNRDICEKDKEKLCGESETNVKIVKSCKGIIYVDNPPIRIFDFDDNDDDDDDDGKEANIRINRRTREKSRIILLDHLKKVCQEEVQIHMGIDV
ncbi:hypothetical protein RhiirA5_451406 [Rhizophagus irregularis]|uniref:AIG1-type G domain-containing protein n=1 Tax=Rhizophagus irregularis TaxID=588596 RepID=A0A2I1EW39_9GLOM|nr:hypothetical protein RhiirA5_451406 [Rhizophagus irregularis]PKC60079.1 hypothetical protein RhiirA1_445113 [Rhizophagus irregularis]PKY26329.1 hypothetical protein RhiirB3_513232 [Rhizophagus irregularis]CAB4493566.1 unnamed protein product [Rhizophagus irregularis]CAB5208584.1 unnamed protein product [Rhizophagus irregularis]